MSLNDQKLKEILIAKKIIDEEKFLILEKEAQEKSRGLEELLVENNIIEEKKLIEIIATELKVPFVFLKEEIIDDEVLRIIPEIVAKKQWAIAFARNNEGVKVATHDPENLDFFVGLQKKTGEKIFPFFTIKDDIKEALLRYKKPLKEEFEQMIAQGIKEIESSGKKDMPVIKIVESIIIYAYQNKVSDIHIEPQETKTVIRYRIDGILHDVLDLPKFIHEHIVARIKILAQLRIDEHRAAQDGRFSQKFDGEKVDLRVSILPITKGEKIVLRLLSERVRRFDLEDLGFSKIDFEKIQRNIKKPWGMILSTGPTGSGKTTSLYSFLKILNTREVNIATIEDPVEYDIEGVNQIQVDTSANLTFAEGLRAIVRQDPDIMMVGEIRDKDTAEIAINAALTGHLVLSTFHTNDAPTTLPRLVNLGVEPFLIASTVNIIVAQRLIRKICPKCSTEKILTKDEILKSLKGSPEILEKLLKIAEQNNNQLKVHYGQGCPLCYNSGYLGRIGIFEILEMSEKVRDLVMQKSDALIIRKQAIEEGMTTMIEDGLNKVFGGLTTLEEVLMATKE